MSWPIFRVFFRYRAYGKEHLPASGGFVLAAGHVSNIDPWPLGLGVFPQRFLRFMAKSELFWPPLGWFINAAGAFKVNRGTADRAAIETAVELAREGNVIAMFPEGTRRTKGLRKKYTAQAHTGAARIARDAGVPLVPAGIRGTDRLNRLGPLRVRYGTPVEVTDDLDETTERLMAAIRELEHSLA
ncbi:MAG TPA: lysophospholipid acyltransferase family protein [Gaiellaceae bacterium]